MFSDGWPNWLFLSWELFRNTIEFINGVSAPLPNNKLTESSAQDKQFHIHIIILSETMCIYNWTSWTTNPVICLPIPAIFNRCFWFLLQMDYVRPAVCIAVPIAGGFAVNYFSKTRQQAQGDAWYNKVCPREGARQLPVVLLLSARWQQHCMEGAGSCGCCQYLLLATMYGTSHVCY